METFDISLRQQGETADVSQWLSRAGLSFDDLGSDASSIAIRKQWREYQAAVRMLCVATHQPPDRVQLSGIYAKLRVPQRNVTVGKAPEPASLEVSMSGVASPSVR